MRHALRQSTKRKNPKPPRLGGPQPLGICLMGLAALGLVLGLALSNLAFLFWGGAFLCLSGLAALSLLFEGLRLRGFLSRVPGLPECGMSPPPGAAFYPDEALVMRATGPAFHPLLPWMEAEFLRDYPDGTGSWYRATMSSAYAEAAQTPAARGHYRSSTLYLTLRDCFGLFSTKGRLEIADEFSVFPRPMRPEREMPPGRGGPSRATRGIFRKSEDFLDARKYLPGDDIRRLHWKQYAHSGELFTRLGEPIPPPRMEYDLIVLPDTSLRLGGEAARAYAEIIISLASGLVLDACQRSARLRLLAPGSVPYAPTDEAGPEADFAAAQEYLARARLGQPMDFSLFLSGLKPSSRLYVLCAAANPSLNGLCSLSKERGIVPEILLAPVPCPAPGGLARSIRGIFIKTEARGLGRFHRQAIASQAKRQALSLREGMGLNASVLE